MIVAFATAGVIAAVADLMRMLTAGGSIAGTFVGGAALLAGKGWVVLLLFFFISSSVVSRWRAPERERLVGPMVEKGSRRDAVQVLANGIVFAVAALFSIVSNPEPWQAAGAGAIAAATADTWSTEIGTVLGGAPRMLLAG